jgi:hypothetical protein
MAPKFSKGERVRVLATKFDNEKRDNAGMNFSERWPADGNGTWCFGTISRVYVKRRGAPQKYSIKYDIGGTMACEEQHIENAGIEESDSDESKNDEREEVDSDAENEDNDEDNETDNEEEEGGTVMEMDQDKILTDESEGEGDDNADRQEAEITEIGETIWCGKEDDPARQCWRRVEGITEDVRTEETKDTTLKNLRITDNTTELEIFWALMPLKQEDLVENLVNPLDNHLV